MRNDAYAQVNDQEKKVEFVEQLNLCWLYCPDEVIKSGYDFLNAINSPEMTLAEKQTAHGDFVVAICKDLLSREITRKTKLTSQDYTRLSALQSAPKGFDVFSLKVG